MNDLLYLIKHRRSIRCYTSQQIPQEALVQIIDDPSLKSGFYGAPTVCAIFCQERFLYSIPDAFCIAENMVLMATSLGIASCIVARGEDTFRTEYGKTLLKQWRVPEGFVCRAFVLLGYIDGEYPSAKSLKEGRAVIVE